MKRRVPIHRIHWKSAWRVIPTRYPEINLFARVATDRDLEAVNEIEGLTNNRVRQLRGERSFLRPTDHFPPRCNVDVLKPFTARTAGRFNRPGVFGAFYAANNLMTATREKAFHHIQFLHDAGIPPATLQMRVIKSDVQMQAHDLRGRQNANADLYHPTDYTASQQWAYTIWKEGAQGVVYESLRSAHGECVAVFSPQCISHCRKDRVLEFVWNGENEIQVRRLEEFLTLRRPV